MVSTYPVAMDTFQLVQPEDVNRIRGGARLATCILDPCPFWLIKAARDGLAKRVRRL